MWVWIIAGLGVGFMGSFHCVGMCGPIALSLPIQQRSKSGRLLAILLYNLGRSLTYAAIGAVFGFLGSQLSLIGYQQAISIVCGLLVLFVLLAGRLFKGHGGAFSLFHQKVKMTLARLLSAPKTAPVFLLIGMANGLLPCGLVYLAITSALATGSVAGGALLMFSFGMGTFPLMCSLMILGKFIAYPVRQQMRRLVPVFVGVTALLMILRGMNLGIPYISPEFHQTATHELKGCCHKQQ
jgi:sulfite exporter TauE/SafE